ncbi:hypothetical protein MM1S1540310_0656 [Mycobacteroides abscessus subsp. bolletii 1S-154-0310]|uniref:Uncharacterized protein n=1 Tax=Mycobacteroides abscessus subsp. bolletii 1513 TaxID=1299321 RepID=X8DT20_9MYCO|nr:hypothetical protein MA5S0421_0363 [Mycobacteroides abscessus 5S-0421]EIU17707.1 hypothetical protein MA5S0304_0107 [Mycobacteroides abscessus 5S-0304]EIU18472.1 hypothetical protein MA5S0422_1096 [Mycobacteroides abscessus 5S-0422]EIU26301.1 hypothetical protein MA5S0708_2175 [Mycobacteroides abscessus 5S-0708]EIU34852.1 hypothetical protein MA5S0817_0153 [Mycobacteroides abscessus 5S-0817]EIU35363.1 hypothetical protein MA5S1212_0545 [Mycobacteroides abscessus 5S-1212]EIU41559.1 hypothet
MFVKVSQVAFSKGTGVSMDVNMKICVLFNIQNHCANCPPASVGRSTDSGERA